MPHGAGADGDGGGGGKMADSGITIGPAVEKGMWCINTCFLMHVTSTRVRFEFGRVYAQSTGEWHGCYRSRLSLEIYC